MGETEEKPLEQEILHLDKAGLGGDSANVYCTENERGLVWDLPDLRLSGHILVKCSLRRPSTVRMQKTYSCRNYVRVSSTSNEDRFCMLLYLMVEASGMTCGNAAPGITPLGLGVRTRSC